MFNKKAIQRVNTIQKKINFIFNIVEAVIKDRLPLILDATKKILNT